MFLVGSVTELQRFIIKIMVNWSREEILDPSLISQIFALLYRQYDEVNEVSIVAQMHYYLWKLLVLVIDELFKNISYSHSVLCICHIP